LHYFGDVHGTHEFLLELNSSRIHPLNWGNENNKKLVPPNKYLQKNLEEIEKKINNCKHGVSNHLLQMVTTLF
jgi:hypothetical protein